MKKKLGIIIALVTCIFLVFGSANATPIMTLDFFITPSSSGSISYAGSASPLAGSNISVSSVVGLNTPLNAGVSLPVSALLNFNTGASTGVWAWGGGPGSSISMTGSVSGVTTGTLLSGSFGSAFAFYGGNSWHLSGASFSDVKNQALLAFYGLPYYTPGGMAVQNYSGNFNISFYAPYTTTGASFASSQVLSGNLSNAVPEPGTLLLLGFGMTGLGLARFRKKFRK